MNSLTRRARLRTVVATAAVIMTASATVRADYSDLQALYNQMDLEAAHATYLKALGESPSAAMSALMYEAALQSLFEQQEIAEWGPVRHSAPAPEEQDRLATLAHWEYHSCGNPYGAKYDLPIGTYS